MELAGRWLRVSRNEGQDEANQERDEDEWIASHGYQLAEGCTYRLRKSAYKGDHEKMLDQVITDMQDGKINVLVVWQSSRIERRGAYSVFDLARRVQQAGGRIEYSAPSDQHLNASNDMSDVMLALSASRDHQESKVKSERVHIAQDRIRDNAAVLGRLPYGYRAEGDKYSRKAVIVPDEAAIVIEAKDRYLAGESLADICDDFNARGISSPLRKGGQWIVSTLGRLLRNPGIAGRQYSNRDQGERVKILEYDPIISWTDHEALEARLNSRAHRAGISPSNVFMLTSILKDTDGHGMYAKLSRTAYYYVCRNKCGYGVPMTEADAEISEAVTDMYGEQPHMVRRLVPGENYLDQIARKRQDIRELDPEADDYDTKLAEMRAELAHLRSLPSKPDTVKRVPSGKTVGKHWESLSTAGRRDWLIENGWKATAVKDEDGWRLSIDAGWTANVGASAQAESLGAQPLAEYARRVWELADALKGSETS
jgi:DNA invertase Pin-like site-specific DNA recombinase